MLRWHQRINRLLLLLAIVVTLSFGFAVYLRYKQSEHSPFAQNGTSSDPSDQTSTEVLEKAANHLRKNQVEQGLMEYRKILSRNPSVLEAQLGLARGELLAGREEVAAREYERALQLDKQDATALIQLARIYSHTKSSWKQSELKFKEYLKVKPQDVEAQLALARVLAWQGSSREATEIFSENAVARLMTEQDRRDYALALADSGQTEKAEHLLKSLLARHGRDFELRLQLASIYAARQDWTNALPVYRSMLEDQPGNPNLNLTYGLGLLSMKNYKSALQPLQKARHSLPASGEAGLGYARALKGAGDLKAASREFERVLPQYENEARIVRECADLLLEKRDYGKSAKYYRAAFDLGLRDERLLLGLAGALQGAGKHKEALPYLEEAYERLPTDRTGLDLAKLLRKLGQHRRALAIIARIESSASPAPK